MTNPAGQGAQGARRQRRNDPERRERIINACLQTITEFGVAGTSHRKIAAAADVPLGSMTYHFTGINELLREAFTKFTDGIAEHVEQRMNEASDLESARDAVVTYVLDDLYGKPEDLVLTHELYTLAARDSHFREITTSWMTRSRTALERHFDPETAKILDAMTEGLSIHRALDVEERSPQEVVDAINRIVGLAPNEVPNNPPEAVMPQSG